LHTIGIRSWNYKQFQIEDINYTNKFIVRNFKKLLKENEFDELMKWTSFILNGPNINKDIFLSNQMYWLNPYGPYLHELSGGGLGLKGSCEIPKSPRMTSKRPLATMANSPCRERLLLMRSPNQLVGTEIQLRVSNSKWYDALIRS
jgi:hypothetical protein